MTLKEIIHHEDISGNQIHLYREGLFWKAYEYSAYRFVFGINPYKPLKKTIKAAGQDVVSIGFPTASLEKFAALFRMISQDDDHIVIVPENLVTTLSYEQWKEKISFTDTKTKIQQEQGSGKLNIKEEILRFNIESKTPIECMTWLSALKQKIKETSNG